MLCSSDQPHSPTVGKKVPEGCLKSDRAWPMLPLVAMVIIVIATVDSLSQGACEDVVGRVTVMESDGLAPVPLRGANS